tara:strand:+ start:360 stop:461 length:102 start_codon:yes stop_codon:yes gene_type:complete
MEVSAEGAMNQHPRVGGLAIKDKSVRLRAIKPV